MAENSKRIEFTPPDALIKAIGQPLAAGQHLRNMRTEFAVKPDGRWCIVQVEGVMFPGYDQDGNEKEGKQPKTSQFIERYQQEMGGGEAGAGAGGYG